jgi:hypothetical protein
VQYEAGIAEALSTYSPSPDLSPTSWLYNLLWRHCFPVPLAQLSLRVASSGVDYCGQVR